MLSSVAGMLLSNDGRLVDAAVEVDEMDEEALRFVMEAEVAEAAEVAEVAEVEVEEVVEVEDGGEIICHWGSWRVGLRGPLTLRVRAREEGLRGLVVGSAR